MRAGARTGTESIHAGRGPSPRLAFASIWLYAFTSGLAALALIRGIISLTHSEGLPMLFQLATMLIVAVVAGLSCERILICVLPRVAGRRRG